MGVDNNHYNYQIAIIFAILIGGCLLLAATIGGIYYACVVNMRDDKKRLSSRRNSPSPWQQQQQYRPAEPSPNQGQFEAYNPPPPATTYQQAYQQSFQPQADFQHQQNYQPQQNYQTQQSYQLPPQQQQYAPQYETSYMTRSAVPSPMVGQPQPLLAPQNYEPYRPSPGGYDDTRFVSMNAQPVSHGFNQSSV